MKKFVKKLLQTFFEIYYTPSLNTGSIRTGNGNPLPRHRIEREKYFRMLYKLSANYLFHWLTCSSCISAATIMILFRIGKLTKILNEKSQLEPSFCHFLVPFHNFASILQGSSGFVQMRKDCIVKLEKGGGTEKILQNQRKTIAKSG